MLRARSSFASAQQSRVSDLLPENNNPVTGGIQTDAETAEAIIVFDGPGEKRWYDYIDQLDGLTIGFGQWPQSEFPDLLADLRLYNGGRIEEALFARLTQFYMSNRVQS